MGQAEPRAQAGPRCLPMPSAPALTSRVLWGITSSPPLKTFAGEAQFLQTPPELVARGAEVAGTPQPEAPLQCSP